MKIIKRGLTIILISLILGVSAWFTYTRFWLPIYKMDGNTLKYRNETYVAREHWAISDEENLGRTIGIGVGETRTLTDLIWPFWVMEYENDKVHDSLYLRGLMGSGGRYDKITE